MEDKRVAQVSISGKEACMWLPRFGVKSDGLGVVLYGPGAASDSL